MFWLICIELIGIILILYWYSEYKCKKANPLKKFILYCECENDVDFSYIANKFRSFEVFELMSEFRPKLFVKYFRLYNYNDIEKKRKFINNFTDEMLVTMFKYADYATLKNLFDELSYKKSYFMLDWLCKNRFNEFLPLLQSLDKKTEDLHDYTLFYLVYKENETAKFIKYFDDPDKITHILCKAYKKVYSNYYYDNSNFMINLLSDYGLLD